ncbi:hypothetical protein [Trichocoleus sp. FACHB-262]|uniref:hypothetical protein n=1 Tax=Trichocoleus sp. FACHB-262 TaxID=2692869 RepID=UPI001684A374|nr:hypothetical protein [Trichocoleus sp. FACHB-262]MBD2123959.1 hypothetical protein [Trichocoleus sp. FACHB-262]
MEVFSYIDQPAQTPEIDELITEFGSQLQKLTREDKLGLRVLLSTYSYLLDTQEKWALLGAVLDETPVQPSKELDEAIAILEEVDPDAAEGLIEAFTAQLSQYHAHEEGH